MKPGFSWLVMLAIAAGCAKIPFAAEPMPQLTNPNPSAMRDSFARAFPERFTTDDTIIIQAPFHKDLAVLDVLRVDRTAGTFQLVALNHMGIKLFELSGDRANVAVGYILPPLMEDKDIFTSIAHDIANMYLDLIPTDSAKTKIGSNEIRFTEKQSGGTLVYHFGGGPPVLLDKHLDSWFWTKWQARYFRYSTEFGGLYPRGIVMDNGKYHYRIIVKNRDVEIEK